MVVAINITLRTTIGTSTVQPQLLVWCSSNTLNKRCKIVVRAPPTVASHVSTGGCIDIDVLPPSNTRLRIPAPPSSPITAQPQSGESAACHSITPPEANEGLIANAMRTKTYLENDMRRKEPPPRPEIDRDNRKLQATDHKKPCSRSDMLKSSTPVPPRK